MIIALPPTGHDHLADALVRDLGFTRTHVDQPLRDLLLALDPFVDSGVTLANMGPSPRLSSKLEQVGGANPEERWERLLNPPRPGASPDRTATEVKRLLEVLRESASVKTTVYLEDTVIVGVASPKHPIPDYTIAIDGRETEAGDLVDHVIPASGVVGEQQAIVAYVQELREAKGPAGFREIIDSPVGRGEVTPYRPPLVGPMFEDQPIVIQHEMTVDKVGNGIVTEDLPHPVKVEAGEVVTLAELLKRSAEAARKDAT